jgi:cellulose synthase (UDP-forming)
MSVSLHVAEPVAPMPVETRPFGIRPDDRRSTDGAPRTAGIGPIHLPSPPSDEEVYWYLGPQRRSLTVARFVAFLVVIASLLKFCTSSPLLAPFLVVVALNVAGAVIALVTTLQRRRVTFASHSHTMRRASLDVAPCVDVYLPTCGEPIEILRNTYTHVAAMEWRGGLAVYVLDDGDREEVRQLARAFGFSYLVRPDRGYLKKAGNMRSAFARTDGDLIAIFDADFCPRADYLHHLVPYFDDAKVGIVQSPQCFDVVEGMGWVEGMAGATQEYFYRWVQPARDAVGAAICVGTNAVYRRSALDAAGGFAAIEHSEDVHTGIALMRRDYHLRYVPVLLAKGICPDSTAAFMNQQYRWCSGSMSLLASREFHEQRLSFVQRLCFWSGFLYYLTTALNVFAASLPSIVMAWFAPEQVRAAHYVPFILAAWMYFVGLPMLHRVTYRYNVLRIQLLYSFCHAVAIADTARSRTASWVATGAAGRGGRLVDSIRRTALVTIAAVSVSAFGGLLHGALSQGWSQYWPMALFLSGYAYVAWPLAARLISDIRVEHRRAALGSSRGSSHDAQSRMAPDAGTVRAAPAATPRRRLEVVR